MRNNKSINIYMGIIGEAYVDKETAYAVLLAAKKNILDVTAIINSANSLFRPLSQARVNAEKAIDDSVRVYNKLKNAISQFEESDLKYIKLYALLSDLNENDFDDNFSNGGNIFTARENLTFAQSLEAEIKDIIRVAEELLDANKLNAVVRCKEYNIAKEMFEAMIPEKIVSPEEISDAMESELIRRINEVRNNINNVDLVADAISTISTDVENRIENIVSGADTIITQTNETLYWYAGNINPFNNITFMESLGFVLDSDLNTYFYKPEYDEFNEYIPESLLKDFGIDGPLRANKWFHQPLHLIQDGQLIAGVDGGKAKEDFWYVAVPRYIPTAAGSTAFAISQEKKDGMKIQEWAALHSDDTDLVTSLYPAFPKDYEHVDEGHSHPNEDNTWEDANNNDIMEDGEAPTKTAWKKISNNGTLSINNIVYDVWETPSTRYNKQRLNVYFNLGQPEKKETAKGLYWYIGKNKPSYNSDVLHEEGWAKITVSPTAENPEVYNEILDSKIFYIAIPKEFGIFNDSGVDLTDPELEAESPYTIVYTTLISGNTYNVYITGNEDAKFVDKIYAKKGTDIDIDPTPEDPDTPKVTLDLNDYLIYIGLNKPTSETNPNEEVAANNKPLVDDTDSMGWRSIGSDISIYNASNPAFNGGTNTICLDASFNNIKCYVAIPPEMNIYDGLGNIGNWNQEENITIGDHQYKVLSATLEGEFGNLIYGNGQGGGEQGGGEQGGGEQGGGEQGGGEQGGGETDNNYYLFIGTENPENQNPTEHLVANANEAGWHNLGESIASYNSSNPAFNGGANTITLDPEFNDVECFVVIPVEMNIHDGLGNINGSFTQSSSMNINGKEYKVLTSPVEGEFGNSIY